MFDLHLKRHTPRFGMQPGSKVNAGKVCGDRARPSNPPCGAAQVANVIGCNVFTEMLSCPDSRRFLGSQTRFMVLRSLNK